MMLLQLFAKAEVAEPETEATEPVIVSPKWLTMMSAHAAALSTTVPLVSLHKPLLFRKVAFCQSSSNCNRLANQIRVCQTEHFRSRRRSNWQYRQPFRAFGPWKMRPCFIESQFETDCNQAVNRATLET